MVTNGTNNSAKWLVVNNGDQGFFFSAVNGDQGENNGNRGLVGLNDGDLGLVEVHVGNQGFVVDYLLWIKIIRD